jgi:hypothetical protein
MKSAEADWSISLMTTCPHCEAYQCVMSIWYEIDGWEWCKVAEAKILSTNEGKEDFVCECQECKKEFCISETRY